MVARTFEEIVSDNLLFLYLVSNADDLGRTKLQKLVYLIECKLGRKGINTFNYNFYRWNYGPFTEEIFQDGEAMVENGFILDISTKPSKMGLDLLRECDELFDENHAVLNKVDKLIKKYDPEPIEDLKRAVYNSKVLLDGEMIRVEDVPQGRSLKIRVSKEDSKAFFAIDDCWMETLDIKLDMDAYFSLEQGLKDAREGRVCII